LARENGAKRRSKSLCAVSFWYNYCFFFFPKFPCIFLPFSIS
jgi:hypothetical protein